MECSCIYEDVDDIIEEISCGQPRARKPHTCGECDREIQPGEFYERFAGIDDGDFFVEKTCLDCESIRRSFFCSGWHWGMVIERLREHIDDVAGEISSECLATLTPGAPSMVIDMIDFQWSED